jgi:hypothetical protein
MSERYTQGPWSVAENNAVHIGEQVSDLIALVSLYRSGFFIGVDEQKANAQLIAAAPDLLDALERIAEHYSASLPDHMQEEIADVIAKAKGQA